MLQGFKISIMAIIMLMLSACGVVKKKYEEYAPDRDTAYLDAVETPPLKVPANMSAEHINPNTPYPPPHGPLPQTFEPIDIWPPEVPRTNNKPA